MEEDEDCDVLWEGSPLHQHLTDQGVLSPDREEDAEVQSAFAKAASVAEEEKKKRKMMGDGGQAVIPTRSERDTFGVTSMVWPKESNAFLEIEVAQKLLRSELLVQEDEDFISNFILTDEALESHRKRLTEETGGCSGGFGGRRSYLSEALFISGSLAAVAGTVLYLSERTRVAATVAAVLPTAMAAMASVGAARAETSSQKSSLHKDSAEFQKLIEQLLSDMKLFKQLVRKSLNLLQGMELMHSGYMFAVNSSTGGPITAEETQLNKALAERACFPALRKATYQATVELILSYREAVARLLEVSPLADHVDLREHYIAFIDLKNFGISEADLEQVVTDGVSVKALKDVVQLALIQQSEYLRRFSLTFSEKVREDHDLNKAGVLKQVRDLVGSLRKINTKLTSVFDYHQAMGIVPEHKQKSLMASRSRQMDLVPLRTVYTSLFSTGLHLQNSLLKVRQLESIFDKIEKSKTKETDMVSALIPNEEHLVEWLTGFKTIQTELNACVGCLDDGLAQIDLLNGTEEESHNKSKTSSRSATPIEHKIVGGKENIPKIDDDTPQEHLDEVFEAVITHDAGAQSREESSEVDGLSKEERKKRLREKKQSEKLLTELKSVLVVKAISMEEREAHALARKNKIASPIAANSIDEQLCKEELKEVDEIVVEQIKEVVKPAASLLEGSTSESAALVKKDGVEKTCLAEPSIGTFVTSSDSPQKHSPGKNSQSTDESSKDKNGGLGYNGVPNPKEKIPLKVEKKTKDIPKPVISENGRQSKVINSDDSKRIVTEPLQPKSPSNHKIEICATKEENYVGKKMINLNSSLSDSKVAANNSSSKNDLEISKENGNSKEGGITNNLDPFLCAPNDAQNLSSNSNQDANGSKGTFEDAFVLPSDDKEEEELSFDNLKTALSLPHLPEENKKGNPGNGFPETSHLTPLSDNSSSDSNSSLVSSSESSSSDQATVKSVVGSKENMLEESRVMSKSVPRSKSGSELKSGRSFSEEEDSSSYANDDDDSSSPEEDLETEEVKKRKAATLTKLNKDIGRGDYFRSTSVPNTVTNLRAAPSVGSLPSPPKARGNLTSEHCCSLSELRSISSPDIKRLVGEDESTSPYVSLENLKRRRKPLGPRNSSGTNHTESDSECGSADEMQHQVLKTYQRPLRPAAIKKEMKREKSGLPSEKKSGVSSSAAQSRKRRDRNRTRSITSADLAEAALTQKKADSPPSEGVRSNGDGVCSPKRAPANTYVDKKEREGSSIFLPMGRPLGFESSIARQAAARAANGLNGLLKPAKEEIFGASDSD